MTAMLTPHRDRSPRPTVDALEVVRAAPSYAAPPVPRSSSAASAVALFAAFAARVLLGDYTITVPDFFRILTGTDIPGASYILMESKLPRAVLALLAGVAFGVAGALFQTTLRNPLASPDIIGVSLGASATAVVAIALWGWQGLPVSGVAVLGAISVALVVRLVAGPHGGHRLILVGIGLAAAMQSVIQYVFTRVDEYDAQLVLRWLTGSVNGVAWPTIRLLALVAGRCCCPLTWWLCRSLRASELGDDTAAGLGVSRTRSELAPAAGRGARRGRRRGGRADRLRVVPRRPDRPGAQRRADHDPRVRARRRRSSSSPPTTSADYLIPDTNLPVGVVTGAVGAPFLLWLLVRGRTGRRAA